MPVAPTVPALAFTLTGPAGGPPLVLVNGMGGVQAAFALQIKAFADRWRVLTYDQRGLGASEVVDRDVTMRDYALDLVHLLDHLGVERAAFLGLSFGGRVLQELAIGWPERVERLIIGGTSAGGRLHIGGSAEGYRALTESSALDEEGWRTRLLPALFGPVYRNKYPDRMEAFARWRVRYPTNPVAIARQWQAWSTFDTSDRLHRITAPTLILHGDDDALSPVENAELLAERIPGAELMVLHDVGHSPNVEDPARFNAVVRAFLERPLVG